MTRGQECSTPNEVRKKPQDDNLLDSPIIPCVSQTTGPECSIPPNKRNNTQNVNIVHSPSTHQVSQNTGPDCSTPKAVMKGRHSQKNGKDG